MGMGVLDELQEEEVTVLERRCKKKFITFVSSVSSSSNWNMQGSEEKPVIYLFTDGASSGNPGPGGYGVVLKCAGKEKELSEGFEKTTNNRMELLAVIKGLEAIKWQNALVQVWSDSAYVVKAVNEGWLENWQRKGWKKVKNPDLWQRFLPLYKAHRVSFHWIKGHAGHPENERCDRMAVEASKGAVLKVDEGYVNEKECDSNELF